MDTDEIEEKIVEYCLEEKNKSSNLFAAADCYLRIMENPNELMKIIGEKNPEAEEVVRKIIIDVLDELRDVCRQERGWARYACVEIISSYLKEKQDAFRKHAGRKIDETIHALEKMRPFKK